VLKVLTNKCRCKQDVALYNCCNIEYNHGKIFTMIAKPMKNWELQSLYFAIFSCDMVASAT